MISPMAYFFNDQDGGVDNAYESAQPLPSYYYYADTHTHTHTLICVSFTTLSVHP